ncbi:hypothetical protein ElyMa_005201500 [Elysia marginata]|uniref:Uncharacterized protein n=1 Tax=Elysia marginata TaxID=1093978 RepID=A0AAV4JTN4_9GAST|nr:hypothetical protein ElyMa_005201500 [Elysia marginata]
MTGQQNGDIDMTIAQQPDGEKQCCKYKTDLRGLKMAGAISLCEDDVPGAKLPHKTLENNSVMEKEDFNVILRVSCNRMLLNLISFRKFQSSA